MLHDTVTGAEIIGFAGPFRLVGMADYNIKTYALALSERLEPNTLNWGMVYKNIASSFGLIYNDFTVYSIFFATEPINPNPGRYIKE